MTMKRTDIIVRLAALTIACFLAARCGSNDTAQELSQNPDEGVEVLYNGIVLPEQWPPQYPYPSERAEMPLPYIDNRPEHIIANVGRQLFVDDFLIAETDLERVNHHARMYEGNPVMVGDKEWDIMDGVPFADPYSGGVWFDEKDGKFKIWYRSGEYEVDGRKICCTAYAESMDGKTWVKPELDFIPGTNIIDSCFVDSRSVWVDKLEKDPARRYKSVFVRTYGDCRYDLKYSADGIHWSESQARSGKMQDRSTVFYNPFRNVWVASLRIVTMIRLRSRGYMEDSNLERLVRSVNWEQDEIDSLYNNENYIKKDSQMAFWLSSDDKDYKHPDPEIAIDYDPAIYNFDATAYESLMLGQYSVWRGPENWSCRQRKIQKLNEFCVGYSRDGFHFYRPDHTPFMESRQEEEVWNYGNMQPAIGNPCIVGDSLYFFCGGHKRNDIYWDGWTSTGLGILRRDGFVSMNDNGKGGTLTTWPLVFDGKYFFVNASAGVLAVEVLDEAGSPVKGYGKDDCKVLKEFDSTKQRVVWKGHRSLAGLAGPPLRFKFYLTDGELYAFWISPWKTGESRGYLGGGGPGLNPTGIDVPFKK